MDDNLISLEGLDRAAVLAALYNASKPQGMGFLHYDPAPMTVEEARDLLDKSTYFDYLKGRVMKTDLSKDTIDPWGYDRDNGEGAVQSVIDGLRKNAEQTNSESIQQKHATATLEAANVVKAEINKEYEVFNRNGWVEVSLGLSDVADILLPKVDKAVNDLNNKE